MIYEVIESFTEGLLQKTKKDECEWKSINSSRKALELLPEIELATGADMGVNTVALWKTYFFEHENGYVFLVYMYHGDWTVTSPEMDTISLMVKVNEVLPVENLSAYFDSEEHQQKLSMIKTLIDKYYEERYCMPDTLYKFMESVLEFNKYNL